MFPWKMFYFSWNFKRNVVCFQLIKTYGVRRKKKKVTSVARGSYGLSVIRAGLNSVVESQKVGQIQANNECL